VIRIIRNRPAAYIAVLLQHAWLSEYAFGETPRIHSETKGFFQASSIDGEQLSQLADSTGSPLFESETPTDRQAGKSPKTPSSPPEKSGESPLFEPDSPASAKPSEPDEELFSPEALPAPEITAKPPVEVTRKKSVDVYVSGRIAGEYRLFPNYGLQDSMTYNHNFALAIEPQLKIIWNRGEGQFSFVPFLRLDEHDSKRSHYDVREFLISHRFGKATVRAGIGRVFWGVTESRHTVDIINQTDLVENPDGEDKLGQPLLNLEYASEFGVLQGFFLPFSRARTYPGEFGRIRPPVTVAQNAPEYNGNASTHHPDFAVRWSHSIDRLDIGVAHFHGTTREPVWRPQVDSFGIPTKLIPVYDVIDQTSLDLALAQGNWLWKLEAFTRSGQGPRFEQVTGGFEYTMSGVFDSGADMGLLVEYLYDGREKRNLTSPYENDLFLGMRLGLNDTQSTELLSGIFVDTSNGTVLYNVEASRRIGDSWRINFEARGFAYTDRSDFAHMFRRESYLMFELEKYF
jgi:hypothetical protein